MVHALQIYTYKIIEQEKKKRELDVKNIYRGTNKTIKKIKNKEEIKGGKKERKGT